MSKHTPGPWVIYRPAKYPYIKSANPSCRGQFVLDHNAVAAYVRDHADALLIAAAPELLEALKRLDAAMSAIREDLGADYPALIEAWVCGRAAIAEAEGLT